MTVTAWYTGIPIGVSKGADVRVTMAYTETLVKTPPDVRATMVYTETVVKP